MQLYIPEIGTEFRLEQPWRFRLYAEDRNERIADLYGYHMSYDSNHKMVWVKNEHKHLQPYNKPYKEYDTWYAFVDKNSVDYIDVEFPINTILKVDRIYIRRGLKEFSSISFYAQGLGTGKRRFWAKLSDCNQLQVSLK